MKDADYLELVAAAIDQLQDDLPDPIGDGTTQTALRDIASRIRLLEARPTKADIEVAHVLVSKGTTLANLVTGMDRAYSEAPAGEYHDLQADVARVNAKVWRVVEGQVS